MKRILLLGLILLTLSLYPVAGVHAQTALNVTDIQVAYRFGEEINIRGKVSAPGPLKDISVLFRAQGESATRSGAATLLDDGSVQFKYMLSDGNIRPFAPVVFWFRATLQSGDKLESAHSRFQYVDNRFPWKTVEDGNVRLHWYTGDDAFALQARDIARLGVEKTSKSLLLTPTHKFDVYIYALTADLHSAMELGGESFNVGGEASPDLGVALVAIRPGLEQGVEMEEKIPHELGHLITFELVGDRYSRLPIWLREGIASMAEPANTNYAQALRLAKEQAALIPIKDLCHTFPPESSRVLLAYAEADSFTRYLVNKHGDSGLVNLAKAYADGLDCEQGFLQAFSLPLTQAENQWLGNSVSLPNAPNVDMWGDLLPYVALLLFLGITPFAFVIAVWRKPYARR